MSASMHGLVILASPCHPRLLPDNQALSPPILQKMSKMARFQQHPSEIGPKNTFLKIHFQNLATAL